MAKDFTRTFMAGKYYVGDPCYAVANDKWSKLLDDTGCLGLECDTEIYQDGVFYYNGRKCFTASTRHGDGSYRDNHGRVYGVDAGLIGIMPLMACDGDSMNGGHIIRFPNKFTASEINGVFIFTDGSKENTVRINTN